MINGNIIGKTDGPTTTTYTYDVQDRLIQVTDSNGLDAEYRYDPFGRRLSKTVTNSSGTTTTYFLYADEGLIAEANAAGDITKTYGWQPNGVWGTDPLWMHVINSTTEPAGYFWYENDHLGTPQKLTTPSGAVVWSATMDAFGMTTVDPASTVENNLGLPGQYRDSETGLANNWYRYYDPVAGRYLSQDPIGTGIGLNSIAAVNEPGEYDPSDVPDSSFFDGRDANLYSYSLNNPINSFDPLGLLVISVKYSNDRYGSVTIVWNGGWPQVFNSGTRGDNGTEIKTGIYDYQYGTHKIAGGYPALNLYTTDGNRTLPATREDGDGNTAIGINFHRGYSFDDPNGKVGSEGCHVIPKKAKKKKKGYKNFIAMFKKGDRGKYIYIRFW